MKSIYSRLLSMNVFCVVMILSITLVTAQPTLTHDNISPLIGDTYLMHSTDYMLPGPEGENVTWDFSSSGSLGTGEIQYVDPLTTTAFGDFPGATVAVQAPGGGLTEYYQTGPSGYNRLGFGGEGAPSVYYDDPEKFLIYPFTYGDMTSDTWESTYDNTGIETFRSGTSTVEADGYGTIILPGGQEINDVLRVHFQQEYTDEYEFYGTNIINYSTSVYLWYKPGIHNSVFSLTRLTSDITSNQFGLYMDVSSVGIADQESEQINFEVTPNPMKDFAIIQVDLETHASVELSLVNTLGQVVEQVYKGDGMVGKNSFEINPNLPSGVYFVRLAVDGEVTSRQIIIE